MDNRWTYSRTMAVRSGELALRNETVNSATGASHNEVIFSRLREPSSKI